MPGLTTELKSPTEEALPLGYSPPRNTYLGGINPFMIEYGEFTESKTFDSNHSGLLLLRYKGGNDVLCYIIDKYEVIRLGKTSEHVSVTANNTLVTVSSTGQLTLMYKLIKI